MTYWYKEFTHLRSALLLPFILLNPACSLNNIEDWPQTLPAVEQFIQAYEADPVNQQYQDLGVYLYWVTAFYQGNIAYPTGWQDVENIILEQSGEEPDPVFSRKLQDLGVSIAAEWSKENPIRKIDNRMLSMWASTLQIALGSNKHREAVDLVAQDIESLFANELSANELTDARYETLLGLELFGGF